MFRLWGLGFKGLGLGVWGLAVEASDFRVGGLNPKRP